MYRPKKRKYVRRISAASVVAVGAAVGLGLTILNQSGASNSAISTSGEVTATAKTVAVSGTSANAATTPVYHIVGLKSHPDDGGASGDN
jgi:hypothetical protein